MNLKLLNPLITVHRFILEIYDIIYMNTFDKCQSITILSLLLLNNSRINHDIRLAAEDKLKCIIEKL